MIVLRIYKVLSFILLPIGAFLGLSSVLSILVALGNISLLLPLFMLGCTSIYIFTSFSFVYNGIIKNKPCKHALLDWIKVNAYVSLLFAGICIMQFMSIKTNPAIMQELNSKMVEMQKSFPKDSAAMIPNIITGSLYFLLILGILLIIHIALTFKLTKHYAAIFEEK
jgi:hypothetical protein